MSTESGRSSPARRVPTRISVAVGTGSLLQPLNSSMIAVALVTIGADLGIHSGISWLISALYLATAVAAPTAGRLADLFGPRRVFFAGLVLVALGGVLGPLIPNLGGLIASRIVLGVGTATQYPAAMAIIRARARRTREDASGAMAVLGVCAQVSVAFGPTIGGLLVGGFGWQAIFLVNVPLTAIAAVWVWRVTEPDRPRAEIAGQNGPNGPKGVRGLDLLGLFLFAAGLTTLMLFLLSLAGGVQWGWLVAVVPLLIALVLWERRRARPFLDLSLLSRSPRLGVIFLRQLLVSTAFYSIFYSVPQWLEGVRGFPPEQSGLLIIPIAAIGVVSTLVATRLIRRTGFTPTLLVGNLGLVVGGLLVALVLSVGTPVWAFLIVAAVLGIPNGFNNMANQNELYASSSAADIGAASGLLRTTQYVGANLSAALLEIALGGPISDAGLHRVGIAVAAVSVLLTLVSLADRLSSRTRQRRAGR